ncbi:MAG: hypothetical protein V4540_01810 [Pseudomonadota bacterium]
MTTVQTAPNPFALMMDPDAVFAALASSDRLSRLKSRICRPLDKPLGVPPEADKADSDEVFEAKDE